MEKITKKAFIEGMTEKELLFCGITCCGLKSDDELENFMKSVNNSYNGYDTRTYKARSRDLVSNTGSHIDFAQKGKHTFFKVENSNGKILIHRHYVEGDDWKSDKATYYYIAA